MGNKKAALKPSDYVHLHNHTQYSLLDGLTNKGTLQVNGGGGSNTILQIGNNLTLSGGGTVNMSVASGGGNAFLRGSTDLDISDLEGDEGEPGDK